MYYRRKIDEYLKAWKADPAHKPLIVKGARQVGKTESITHFAKENYENVVYINLAMEKEHDLNGTNQDTNQVTIQVRKSISTDDTN